MKKKNTKSKLPVIKKNNKWYNTITGKYVSEAYAKRINNFYKKYPDRPLVLAGGHGKYKKKQTFQEQSRQIRNMAYSKGTQVIKTKNVKGKDVYYSPFQDETFDIDMFDFDKLDYKIQKNISVELYRLTRDRRNIYHLINWKINKRFITSENVYYWQEMNMHTYDKIEDEIKKILSKNRFSSFATMFCRLHFYIYSDLDGNDFGLTTKPRNAYTYKHYVDRKNLATMRNEFESSLQQIANKLDEASYHELRFVDVTFYIIDSAKRVKDIAKQLGKYRIGIIK